ncbi:MAG TPA: zinc ribbon domain-containing protein [Ureibacillus sp.]|nr:zinc ribbon domain-containing protein [Ureibacillus sp.]
MYCKTCGESNPDWSNYCSHDGTSLSKPQSVQQFQAVRRDITFCPHCGAETKEVDNYCIGCGHTLLKFEKVKVKEGKPVIQPPSISTRFESFSFSSLLSKNMVKKALIPASVAFLLMLLLNYISYASINNFYEEIFKESLMDSTLSLAEDFSVGTDMEVNPPGSLFGFTDSVMLSHIIMPSYEAQMESNYIYHEKFTGELDVHFTYILFILFPILSLFVAGIVYRKTNPVVSNQSFLSGSIGIGLIYSLILTVFSLFSGFSYNFQLADEGAHIKFDVDTSYSLFAAIFNGFIIGTVFSLLGMLFSINFRQITKHLENLFPYGGAIHQGFASFTRGFLALSVIMVIILASKLNEWKSKLIFEWIDVPGLSQLLEKTTVFATYIGVQLSSILYSMLHFSPLSLKVDAEGESGAISYSILSGFHYSGSALHEDMSDLEYFLSFSNLDLYLKLAMLIPVLLLLFAGYSLAKSNQASFQSLAVFSLVYSLFTATLAAACAIHIEGMMDIMDEGKTAFNFSLAVSTIRVFISSFLLAYVIGFIGSYLSKLLPNTSK